MRTAISTATGIAFLFLVSIAPALEAQTANVSVNVTGGRDRALQAPARGFIEVEIKLRAKDSEGRFIEDDDLFVRFGLTNLIADTTDDMLSGFMIAPRSVPNNIIIDPLPVAAEGTTLVVRVRLIDRAAQALLAVTIVNPPKRVTITFTPEPIVPQPLRLLAPAEASARDPEKPLTIEIPLLSEDNYGYALSTTVTATLAAQLDQSAVFVDAAGNALGNVDTSHILIPPGMTTSAVSLRVRLAAATDATLTLTLSSGDMTSIAVVSLRAVPRVLESLILTTPPSVTPSPERPLAPVSVEAMLSGIDNYGSPMALSGTLTAVIDGGAVFVDEGGKGMDMRTMVAVPMPTQGTTASASLRVRLTAAMDATLTVAFQAGGLSSAATVILQAPTRMRELILQAADVETSADAPLAPVKMEVVLGIVDNYDGPTAASGTLTAVFNSGAVFVDEDGRDTGMRAVIAVPAPMAAEATTASVSLRVRLTANMDATLHLLFQEVGGLSALDNAELQAASPEFRTFEINAPLEVSASAVTPSQKIDVRMTILARDNYNHLTAVNAMLDVELEGAILYIDPAGNERKDVPSRIVRIPSEGLDVLRTVRLTSDADAELTLTVSELNFSSGVAEAASVTVSVRAASRQLRTLLIDASSTVTVGAEAEDVDVSIRGRDNYGDPIAVSGMLTAVLDGDAVFVDEDGKERTRAVIAVPASMEAATASVSLSLRVRLTAAMDATLHLSFQAGGLSSELVSVRLQAAPGRLSRLLIEAPASAPLMQGRPQIVNVPVRALDGYGVGWREAVEVNFHAALESGAVFVDEAGMAVGNVVTSTLLIGAGGSSTGSLRVRLDSDFGVTLRMTIATDHLSAEAEMELTLMVSTFRADMCAALDIAAMDCARLAAAFTSGGEGPVAGGVAGDDSNLGWSTAVTATAVGGSALASPAIADDQHSCLGFAIRLDEPEALSFDWRVSSQAGDSLRLWVDGGSGAMDVIDGDSGQWRRHSRELGVGDHRIRWCYQKNAAGAGGSDAAWLDNMRINPLKILVVSIDGTTAQTLTQPQPFKTASATLKLRLLDGFRNPLPLSNLASDFPLQIKVIAPQGAQAYWSPRTIEFSQIAGDALFHRVDLSVSPPSNDGTALRIFVETAQLNVSNSLSLKPASPLEFRRTFCDAVGASDADCELITSVESRGDTPWFIDDAGLLRSGEVDGSRRSCLHVFAALPDARTLDFDISIVTEEALIDTLTFELNGDQKAKIPAVDDIFNLGEPVDFAYQGELEAGEAELSWCYEDAYDFAGDDAGVLRAMRFIKLARLEVVTAPRLELSPEGHPATLHLSLGAYDNYGEFWPRPLTTTLVATLNEGAVFVDDDGDAGDVVTSMILLNSVEEMHSLHLRLSAAHAVTLTLTLEGGGLTMQTTVGLEVRSEFQSAMCQALDVSETDCARFANFFTAGEMALSWRGGSATMKASRGPRSSIATPSALRLSGAMP